jgi:hypothetical protein
LKAQLDALAEQIQRKYEEFRSIRYHLYAVWIHQGTGTGSGHYYTCIKDAPTKLWRKYNDTHVSEVSFAEMKSLATGGLQGSSAYVLVYISNELMEQMERVDGPADLATLPADLQVYIRQALRDVEKSIATAARARELQTLRQHAEAVMEEYSRRLTKWNDLKKFCNENKEGHNLNIKPDVGLHSFCCYLFRYENEKMVWIELMRESLAATRELRRWRPEDEAQVLARVEQRLRAQRMLIPFELVGDTYRLISQVKEREDFEISLRTAAAVDEALTWTQDDVSRIPATLGGLAYIWINLDQNRDKNLHSTTEILHIMSATIHYMALHLQDYRDQQVVLEAFEPLIKYCLLLLKIVNWPTHWKKVTLSKITATFPHHTTTVEGLTPEEDERYRNELRFHEMTVQMNSSQTPEASSEFFYKHQTLVNTMMETEEELLRKYCDMVAEICGGIVRPRGLI